MTDPAPVFTATVEPAGLQFPLPPGLTLLQAALQAGVRLPSSCRNGTCRTCLSQLRSGAVHHTIEWPGLSAEEKAEGCILPCVAVALSDIVFTQTALQR
ncbi:MAG: 2Fe-2S iron-sulfur cluster-binding protein [Rubrivivax sp.]